MYALAAGLLNGQSPVSCAHLLDLRMPPSLLDLDEPTNRVQAGRITGLSLLDRRRAVYPEASVVGYRLAPPTRARSRSSRWSRSSKAASYAAPSTRDHDSMSFAGNGERRDWFGFEPRFPPATGSQGGSQTRMVKPIFNNG